MSDNHTDDDPVRAYEAAAARTRTLRLLGVLLIVVFGGLFIVGICLVSAENTWNTFIMETIH